MASGTQVGRIYYTLDLDDSALKKGIDSTNQKVTGLQNTLRNTGILIAGAFAAKEVLNFASSAVRSFEESQNAIAQTNAVLQSTGGIAGVTAKQVDDLSKSFEKSTTYSDEAVRSAENVLLTFTNISSKVLPDATAAVLDMSTALHMDLQSSSIMLGKALQDPIHGMTALSRVGALNRDDFERLNNEWKDGTVPLAQQQRELLSALSKEFAGSASAAADTYAGKIAKLKNQWDDLKEGIGQLIVNALSPLADAMSGVVGWMSQHESLLKTLLPILAEVVGSILLVIGAIKTWQLVQAALNLIMETNPIIFILMAIVATILIVATHWQQLKDIVANFWQAIQFYASAAWAGITSLWNNLIGFFGNLWQGLKAAGGTLVSIITAPYRTAFNLIADLWNATVGRLSFTLPSWIPGLGGKGFSMPKMPHLAQGGFAQAGMPYMVGEKGREMFVPSVNGRVLSNSQTNSLMGGGRSSTYIYGDINIASDVDADRFLDRLGRNVELKQQGLTA